VLKVKLKPRDKRRIETYLRKIDRRVSAFFRGTATHAGRLVAHQVNQKLDPSRDPLSKEYSDGVRTLRVKGAERIPKDELGLPKPLTRVREEHWAAIAVRAEAQKGDDLFRQSKNIIIKIKPHRRKLLKNRMSHLIPLIRYGPWTPDTIPYIPKPSEALVLYVKVPVMDRKYFRDRNIKDMRKVRSMLAREGISTKDPLKNLSKIYAVEEIEYYALRREFGLLAAEKPIWKPSIKFMKKKGAEYLITTNKQLWRTLFDPSYKGYGMLGRFTEIDADHVKSFQSFQDKVR